jgi:hypothetical protein
MMNLDDNDRSWQETDVVYVLEDGTAFFSFDGEGRVWYDSLAEAQAETGLDKVVHF